MNESLIDQQKKHESEMVRQAQILRETFSTVPGQEALKILLDLCCYHKQLPTTQLNGMTSGNALYFGGRRDVGQAVLNLMNFTPSDQSVVVKTKRA